MSSALEMGIIVVGVLAHAITIVGVILSFKRKNKETTLKFCWAGFGTILAIVLTAWIAYESGIHDGVSRKFLAQLIRIRLAVKPLTYAVFAVVVPFLLSILLLFRGLSSPTEAEKSTRTTAYSILTVLCLSVGIGFLCTSLFSYLDFDSFLVALISWWV